MRLVLAMVLVAHGCSAALPTGIINPTNWWQPLDPINDTRPSNPGAWPSTEAAGYYYIDNSHGSATDTMNTYGYPDKPRLTMPTVLGSNTLVVLRGGPYCVANFTSLNWTGNISGPLWISGDPTTRTRFTNTWRLRTAEYVFIENITWTNKTEAQLEMRPGANGESIHHVAVRNCEIVGDSTDAGGSGAMFSVDNTSFDTPVANVVFSGCVAHDGGDWQSGSENDMHGFGVGAKMTNIWWMNCISYRMGGDGFGNGHGVNYTANHLFWGDCVAYTNRENGIDLKEVSEAVISGGEFYGYRAGSSSSGEGIIIHTGPDTGQGTSNCWIFNTLVTNCDIGIISTECHGTVVWAGNIVTGCTAEGLSPDRGGDAIAVWNNTVTHCGRGIGAEGSGMALDIRNNIVLNCTNKALFADQSSTRDASSVLNECYFGASISIDWGSTYTSVAAWIAGTSVGDGSIQSDPLLTNFRPSGSSPVVNAGTALSTLESGYLAVFGFALNYRDRDGTARPYGAWDIGAFEYLPGANSLSGQVTISGKTTIP